MIGPPEWPVELAMADGTWIDGIRPALTNDERGGAHRPAGVAPARDSHTPHPDIAKAVIEHVGRQVTRTTFDPTTAPEERS